VITSVDNPRVKDVLALRKSRERRRRRLFIAEGPREVERARAAGLNVVATYFAPELLDWPHGEPVSTRVLRKMAYRGEPEGVLAVVEVPPRSLPENGTLYLVAVGVEKPGNLGAMARSAEGAGADALIVAEAHADPWNPNAIRASTGAVFTLPIVEASLADVRRLGIQLIAAAPEAATRYTEVDLTRPIAIAIGAEDTGLPRVWREAADVTMAVPLKGTTTDSLNAATTAAILLFEAVRQRVAAGHASDRYPGPR
jgi:TrmH family RNA methyltransferase